MLIIVWQGDMLNYSLLVTFVHVWLHVLATLFKKQIQYGEKTFFNI